MRFAARGISADGTGGRGAEGERPGGRRQAPSDLTYKRNLSNKRKKGAK